LITTWLWAPAENIREIVNKMYVIFDIYVRFDFWTPNVKYMKPID